MSEGETHPGTPGESGVSSNNKPAGDPGKKPAVVIASTGGKGGTGKTLVAVNVAVSLVQAGNDVLLVDCDAENPNAAILLGKQADDPADQTAPEEPVLMFIPVVDEEKCTGCGACARACRQHAIFQFGDNKPVIMDHLCSGCELCPRVCPEGAILKTGSKQVGTIYTLDRVFESGNARLDLWVGELKPGEVRSVKVLEGLFERLEKEDAKNKYDFIVVDTSPGAHCDVEFGLDQADKIMCVTEPTPFGRHDLKRVLDLTKILGKRARVVLNREGMTPKNDLITSLCAEYETPLLGTIPLSETILKAYARGVPFVLLEEEFPAKDAFQALMTEFGGWVQESEPPARPRGSYLPEDPGQTVGSTADSTPVSSPFGGPPGTAPTGENKSDRKVFKIGVVSGKGGVGKTVVTGSLAVLLDRSDHEIIAMDCDVDAPNLAIILNAKESYASRTVKTTEKAYWLPDLCTRCRQCVDDDFCRFHALFWMEAEDHPLVDFLACEGCGACVDLCPAQAFEIHQVDSGTITSGETAYDFPIVYGETILGATTSGKMVTETKQFALETVASEDVRLAIVDGPPGIGCPVVATLSGLDFIIVVMEPTATALHDANRLIEVVDQLQIPCGIILNKADAWRDGRQAVLDYAEKNDILLIGEIPVDMQVPKAVASGRPVVVAFPETLACAALKKIAERILEAVVSPGEELM